MHNKDDLGGRLRALVAELREEAAKIDRERDREEPWASDQRGPQEEK